MYGADLLTFGKIRAAEIAHAMAMRYRKRRDSIIVASVVQKRSIGKGVAMSILGLGCTMILATVFCLRLMRESLAGVPESVSLIPLILCILGFFVCAVCLALFQGLRYSNRIVGPTQRLCSILRLVRKGDLTVRAHLRRGDYLTELAQELNSLIDWLNENPPPGAKTGGDLVHVEEEGPEFDDAEFLPLIGQEKD